MVNLLEDYDNNSNEEDLNNICLCINDEKKYREYIPEFMGYTLKKNMNYTLELIINNKKNIILNTDYYEKDNHYYVENISNIQFNCDVGQITFIAKNKNKKELCNCSFNYKVNNPSFNTDILKIKGHNYNIYIYLNREKINDIFHICKIIYTIPN